MTRLILFSISASAIFASESRAEAETAVAARAKPWNLLPSNTYRDDNSEVATIYGTGASMQKNLAAARAHADALAREQIIKSLRPEMAQCWAGEAVGGAGGSVLEGEVALSRYEQTIASQIQIADHHVDQLDTGRFLTLARIELFELLRALAPSVPRLTPPPLVRGSADTISNLTPQQVCVKDSFLRVRSQLDPVDANAFVEQRAFFFPTCSNPCTRFWRCGAYDDGCGGKHFCSVGCVAYGTIGAAILGGLATAILVFR